MSITYGFYQVNEAFAPQYLSVEKELGLDPEKTNLNGGAIAMGHPVGASGSRITAHLVHELRWANLSFVATKHWGLTCSWGDYINALCAMAWPNVCQFRLSAG